MSAPREVEKRSDELLNTVPLDVLQEAINRRRPSANRCTGCGGKWSTYEKEGKRRCTGCLQIESECQCSH